MGNIVIGFQCTGGMELQALQDPFKGNDDCHRDEDPDTEMEPGSGADEPIDQDGSPPDFEMESEIASSLHASNLDAMAAYDVDISRETAAVRQYLAMLDSCQKAVPQSEDSITTD